MAGSHVITLEAARRGGGAAVRRWAEALARLLAIYETRRRHERSSGGLRVDARAPSPREVAISAPYLRQLLLERQAALMARRRALLAREGKVDTAALAAAERRDAARRLAEEAEHEAAERERATRRAETQALAERMRQKYSERFNKSPKYSGVSGF
eukprot:Transcript_6968.p4 GENE.Transcript_6968~~Transcript_6968.p4  ORF type:complete len:156 (-),score=63.00 Transcript_6968:45-512(-)